MPISLLVSDTGGDLYGVCVANGKELSTSVSASPEISFYGETLTAATRVTTDFFTPSTGTYDHTFANIYPVGDAFRYFANLSRYIRQILIFPLLGL